MNPRPRRRWSNAAPLLLLLAAAVPLAAAGDSAPACLDCHDEAVWTGLRASPHAALLATHVDEQICTPCHGDAAEHIEAGDGGAILGFGGDDSAREAERCLACHAARNGMGAWSAGEHALAGVGCSSCHSIHSDPPARKAGTQSRPAAGVADERCFGCHPGVRAETRLPSRHPLAEGRMTCASCHDPHGMEPGLLRTSFRRNDLCLSCHPAMQGPFAFQHEPVEEDCLICHRPHGAPADNLLAQAEPFVCLQCHEVHFHAVLGGAPGASLPSVTAGNTYDRQGNLVPISVDNPFGAQGMKRSMLTKCSQCHTSVHGSDLPSQAVTSGGQGLTR